jgi:hypothetical protein
MRLRLSITRLRGKLLIYGAMDSAEAAGVQCRLVRCLLLFNILAHDADRRTAARCSEIAG